jgi:preprotein translocase subunit SecG
MSHAEKIVTFLQLVLGVALIVSIVMQNRGAGLSNVFGGGGAIYRTKRGFEKWVFYLTIVMAIAFVCLSMAAVLLSK